jgi:RNA polymerase sigma factor (sigma-70 family)
MQTADIDDVLSVALHRLWRSRKRIDPRRPLRTWFGRIVRNVACNVMKARRRAVRRRQVLTAPQKMDRMPCRECEAPDSPATANPDLPRILSALPFLPPNYRRILLADAVAPTGVAPTDVLARELGLSPSTIREYRRRAPGKVRRIIERQERERERESRRVLIICAV